MRRAAARRSSRSIRSANARWSASRRRRDPVEMVTLTSTPISSKLYQVRVGGDVAALKGMMKALVEADDAARAAEQPRVLDWDFIRGHTDGFEALVADLRATPWDDIERQSGLTREDLESAARCLHEGGAAPSSSMAWASPSTSAARRTCSRSPILRCCAAMSAATAPACVRCAAIPTCRATEPSASRRCPSRNSSIAWRRRFGFKPPTCARHTTS